MLCMSSQLFAQSVRLRTDVDLTVSGTTSSGVNNILINVEEPSGDATADTAPASLYIPIENTVSKTRLYYVNSKSGSPTTLFNTGVSTDVVNIPLRIVTTNSNYYLYAAVKDQFDSKYKVIKQYSVTAMNQGQTFDVNFPVAPLDICTVSVIECTNLTANSNSSAEKNFMVYFFLSLESSYGVNEEVNISETPLNHWHSEHPFYS